MKLLDDTKRKNKKFSKTHLSKSGKSVDSGGEVEVADYLDLHGIPYEKPKKAFKGQYYKNYCLCPDFIIDKVYVEYLGVKGDDAYNKNVELKKQNRYSDREYFFLDDIKKIGSLATRFKHLIGKNPQLKLTSIFNKIISDEEELKKSIEQYYNKEIGENIIKKFNEEYKGELIKLRKELFEKFMKNKGSEFLYSLLKEEQKNN